MKGIYIYISYLLIYQMKDDSFLPPGCCCWLLLLHQLYKIQQTAHAPAGHVLNVLEESGAATQIFQTLCRRIWKNRIICEHLPSEQ